MTMEQGLLLVVDDNVMNRDMLSRRLMRRGHNVLTAADGYMALDMLTQHVFDLVLLDIMMPGIDGMEVLRTVRETQAASELPIIMVTAKDDSASVVAALRAGANDYVTKPLDFPVVLARVQTQLELKRAKDALAAAHARMKRDLEVAARVQQSLLPREAPLSDAARFAWRYRPCDELAGDALHVFKIDEYHIGMYVLDVSGHGVASSLLAVTVTRSLALSADRSSLITKPGDNAGEVVIASPVEVINRLNTIYPMESNGMHFFTIIYGVLDTNRGLFRFASAGHPGPIVVQQQTVVEFLDTPSMPIGITADADYEERSVTLCPGDRLYLYSDGLSEARNASGDMFGAERTQKSLQRTPGHSLAESISALLQDVTDWIGEMPFQDDVSILAFEMLAPPASDST